MSLSLDGRLPSGRRAALLDHIAECNDCTATWDSMKRAQNLALGLPGQRVGPNFRDDLLRRIESGEGAPDVAFRESISATAKVRYLMTGAAAAALLIAALHVFSREEGNTGEPRDRQTVANSGFPGDPLAPRILGESPLAEDISWQPVSEFALAKNTAENCATTVHELRDRVQSLGNRPLREEWPQVEGVLTNYRTAVGVIRWLDDKRFIQLPGELRAEFREADRSVAEIFGTTSWETRSARLQELPKFRLERVLDRLSIECCRSMDDLCVELAELVKNMPEAGQMLQFQIVSPNNTDILREIQLRRPGGNTRTIYMKVRIERAPPRSQDSPQLKPR